jgi:hypothetical protein
MAKAQSHTYIADTIYKKYGNLFWPIIWYKGQNNGLSVECVTFEVNKNNTMNTNVYKNSSIVQETNCSYVYKTNYKNPPKDRIEILGFHSIPLYIQESIRGNYNTSHDYITSTNSTKGIYTIDIDYLWQTQLGNEALEVSTFYKTMDSKQTAEYLVKKFVEKRASKPGAHQFYLLAKVAKHIFNARLRMVFVQTERETSIIVPDSNVIWFELDENQAKKIHTGNMPDNLKFEPLEVFLDKL